MERALLAAIALLLNAALGGPARLYDKLGLIQLSRLTSRLARALERKLNRERRSLRQREIRGSIVVAFAIGAAALAGWFLHWLFKTNLQPVEILLLATLLPLRSTWDTVVKLRKALEAGDLPAARAVLEHTPLRHIPALDAYGLARAGVEMLAVYFSEKIVSPVFWYLLLGLPGFLVSKAVYVLQENIARPFEGEETGFAKTAQMAHDCLHFIPSRLAALLWLFAVFFIPAAGWRSVARRILSGLIATSPYRLALLSAAASLKLALGGPASLYVRDLWIGDGTARAKPADLKRAQWLFAVLNLLLLLLLALFIR